MARGSWNEFLEEELKAVGSCPLKLVGGFLGTCGNKALLVVVLKKALGERGFEEYRIGTLLEERLDGRLVEQSRSRMWDIMRLQQGIKLVFLHEGLDKVCWRQCSRVQGILAQELGEVKHREIAGGKQNHLLLELVLKLLEGLT